MRAKDIGLNAKVLETVIHKAKARLCALVVRWEAANGDAIAPAAGEVADAKRDVEVLEALR